MKRFFTLLFILATISKVNSETFTSIASGNWNTGGLTVWSITGGVDGDNIPDFGDNVIISSGHNISLTANANANTLTINLGGIYSGNNQNLLLKGNFTNNGTATGLRFNFSGAVSIISSSTPLTAFRALIAASTITLAAGSQLTFTSTFTMQNGAILNNNGTLSLVTITNGAATPANPIFNNLNGSALTLSANLPTPISLNSSSNSTVNLNSGVTSIPNWTYHHLTLQGSGSTKTAAATLNVNGNLTNNNGVTLNLANNTFNLAGNLSNSGTFSNINSFNLNGTTNQTLSSSSALTIPTLTSTNLNTIILNTGTYNLSNAFTCPGSLTLNTATLNLNSNALNLAGNLSNSGTISNLLNVNLNGTLATQSISSSQSLAFNNLTCSNPAGVNITSGNHTITNSLDISAGDFNPGNNLVTLVSDATKTAYIANCTGTINAASSMIIQRYIPSRVASYAEFSSPVVSTTIDDWDNELYMTINAPNDVAGYPGGDGLYGGPGEFWSVTQYNTATGTYDSVLTGTALNVGQGYNIWVADDDTQFPGRALDTRGVPNMGTASATAVVDTDPFFPGWNLIGNPHASFIDWSDIVIANPGVSSYIQIYDGSGNYVDDLTQPEIAPGQGFWVEVGANMTINFPQSSKRTTTASTFFRQSAKSNSDLKLRLSSSSNPFYHEINLNFDENANLGFEKGKDITFLKSPKQIAPYIVFTDGANKFIRNKMNTNSPFVVLPLEISTPIAGNYSIELEGLLSNGVYSEAYLVNNTTKEQLEISDANSVTTYFEKGETNNNYSLVLKKANLPFNFNGENISIFSTANFINIKGNFETAQTVKVEVYNIVGQLVMNTTTELIPNDKITLPTSDLQSEVYVVKVTTSDNQQFTNKIVVTK